MFVLKYRPAASLATRLVTLGVYGAITLEQARGIAKRHLSAIADGADPGNARKRAKQAPTMRELGTAFLADVEARNKPSTAAESARVWATSALQNQGRGRGGAQPGNTIW